MDRIRRRVSVVIIVTDACTGRPVEYGECRAGIRGGREAVAKPGGFYVLTDLSEDQADIWVDGRGYQRIELTVVVSKEKAVYVFLIPDRERADGYGHITALSGICRTGKRLAVAVQGKGLEGRLAADVRPGQCDIALYPSRERREGRALFLSGADGRGECIVLGREERQTPGRFALAGSAKAFYSGDGTRVCAFFDVPLQPDGSYYLPFLFPEENGICRVWVNGAEKAVPFLEEGTENRADW